MAFTQIGCSSSYQDSLCLQNSSPPTTVLSSNEINRIGDGFLTSVYDKKNSFWKSEVSTSDVVQKQEEQHFSRNPCIHPGQNSEKLELFGRNLLDDKWSHELQHPAVELKETEAKTHENRLVGTFNHLSSTSTYHFRHYPNPNHHHHHEYPPNYNIPGQHSYQHNRQHAVNSSVLSDPCESANCRQLKGISDLGVTFSGCSEMNLPENTLPLKLNVSTRPSLSSSSSVVSSGSSSSCVQVESQVVNSEFNSNCIGNNTQDFACGSRCEDNLVEYTNCTPYLNKLFSAKILFTNTDRSQHQNHFTGNDKINCISDRSNAISSNQHMNCSTERKSHILHALSSDPPCTSDTTTEECTSVNDKNTLINDRKYDHFIVDYEKFQPNDHKLLSEISTTRNTQMDVCDQYTLKRKISTGLKEQSLSSLSPMTPILPRECSTIHSLAQVLDSKINSPQSPTNCSSVKESINPNITVSLNGSLLHCTSSIHPSTTNVYSHVLNSPHSKQLSYSRTHPNELSNDHHRFFAQNNANSGPYSFSAKPPQHFFPRHTQNPSHLTHITNPVPLTVDIQIIRDSPMDWMVLEERMQLERVLLH
ncbi:unnamed protein product [Heterobilharzia americana]|nr:unnamed protein product [Heterobilharzia americana]